MALRSQKKFNGGSFFKISYTVKEKLVASYDEEKEEGSITVNAPSGQLPYTYLISYDSIPSLDTLWANLKDSTDIDSAFFFQGKVNSNEYVFNNLESGEYFISVFDNTGQTILKESIYLQPKLKLAISNNLIIKGDTIIVDTTLGTIGTGAMLSSFPIVENTGVEFTVTQLFDDIVIGFSDIETGLTSTDNDLEYSLRIMSSGIGYLYKKDVLLYQISNVNIGDKIEMSFENFSFKLYLNNNEIFAESLSGFNSDLIWKNEFKLNGDQAQFIYKTKQYKGAKINKTVVLPVCGSEQGDLLISPSSFHGYSLVSISVTDDNLQTVGSSASFPYNLQLSVGNYSLSCTWSNGTTSMVTVEELTIGFPITWVNHVDVTQISGTMNTIVPTNVNSTNFGTANSYNSVNPNNSFWVQTELNSNFSKYGQIRFQVQGGSNVFLEIRLIPVVGNQKLLSFYSLGASVPLTNLAGTSYQTNGSNQVYLTDNLPLKITFNGTTIKIIHNGTELANVSPNNISSAGELRLFTYERRHVEIAKTIGSFCYPIPVQYHQLFRELKGSYYTVPGDDILRVEYLEEYFNNNLDFVILDASSNAVSGVTYSVSSSNSNYEFGDNRIDFDVSNLTSGFYILQIKNVKGEEFYLRFKVQ